eukprot:7366221-Pyramimonas_sp.AAC.1
MGARNKRGMATIHGTNTEVFWARCLLQKKNIPMPLFLQLCAKRIEFVLDATHIPRDNSQCRASTLGHCWPHTSARTEVDVLQ